METRWRMSGDYKPFLFNIKIVLIFLRGNSGELIFIDTMNER